MNKKIAITLILALLLGPVSAGAELRYRPAATYEHSERSFVWSIDAMERATPEMFQLSRDRYPGDPRKDYTDTKNYTFRTTLTSIEGLNWNPHNWKSNGDKNVISLLLPGLYGFYLNESGTGYAVMPELAAELPEDVTPEYAGSMGVSAGESGKAWRIALNPEAKWSLTESAMKRLHEALGDDAFDALDLSINADDYVYSMKALLDPMLDNAHAGSFCEGAMALYNATAYRQSGQTTYTPLEGTAEDAVAEGKTVCLDMDFWGLTDAPDVRGYRAPKYVPIDDATLYRDPSVEDSDDADAWQSAKRLFDTCLAAGMPYEHYQSEYLYIRDTAPVVEWEDVGIKRVDDYTFDLIFEQPIEDAAFALPYQLRESWLVFEPLYELGKTWYDAEGATVRAQYGVRAVTDYGRSDASTASCGPYALTRFDPESGLTLSRDDGWYGYRDGNHRGMYQADAWNLAVADYNSAKGSFMAGGLDEIALQAGDVHTYAKSDYIRYIPQALVTSLVVNTDYYKLVHRFNNSQILAVDEFREALSWIYDRTAFAMNVATGGTACLGIIADGCIYNPYTGESYRDTDVAKRAMERLYDKDGDPFISVTGYDLSRARGLFQLAYDRAVAASIYNGLEPITLELRVFQTNDYSKRFYEYLRTQLELACKGTGLNDRLSLIMTQDTECYLSGLAGDADLMFVTWDGAALDPYSLIGSCYTDAPDGSGLQMEYGYDTSDISMTVRCPGKEYAASLQEWAKWVNGEEVGALDAALGAFTDYSYDTRCALLAGLEACLLEWRATIPIYQRNAVSLRSQRVEYAVSRGVNTVVADGGLAFATFLFDDDEWAEYIAETPLDY